MEIIKTILLIICLIFTLNTIMNLIVFYDTGRNRGFIVNTFTCIIWGIFYYLNQI